MWSQRKGMRFLGAACGAALWVLMGATAAWAADAPESPVERVVRLYVPMQEALAGDSVGVVKEQAAKVAAEALAALAAGGDRSLLEAVATAARGMMAPEIQGLREQFKPLSRALALLVEKQAVLGLGIYYCPMADAYWIQKSGEVMNPYYGGKMLHCGGVVTEVED